MSLLVVVNYYSRLFLPCLLLPLKKLSEKNFFNSPFHNLWVALSLIPQFHKILWA